MTMIAYARPDERGAVRPGAIGALLGRPHRRRCSRRASATATCCPPDRRSTCASTSSWPTTSPWSSGSTTLAGQPYGADARGAHADYVAHHERDRHGKVVYDFEPFGVDPEALRERLQPYTDRFGVNIEWPT